MFKMNEKYGDEGCLMSDNVKVERYIYLKNYDKAMDILENKYEVRNLDLALMATNMNFYNQLKDNPRYIELLRKMKLPIPKNYQNIKNKRN